MKLTSVAFFLLLLLVHSTPESDQLLAQPLSQFRDGEQAVCGYSLFAALLVLAALYTVALARADRIAEAAIAGLAVVFLAIVAATPSLDGFHIFCSLVLLSLLFAYYALLFYRAENLWWWVHLAVPLILVSATGFHSYGLWQKSLISYFVLLVAAHHHLLVRAPREARPSPTGRRRRGGGLPSKRGKVYLVEQGREWVRR